MTPLYVYWNVNHEIVHLWGNFGIRWYSLLFVSGFIIGYFIFRWFVRREGVKESILDPLLYTLLIATIVGARLGHCIFYEPEDYFTSWAGFWEIFKPWHGRKPFQFRDLRCRDGSSVGLLFPPRHRL